MLELNFLLIHIKPLYKYLCQILNNHNIIVSLVLSTIFTTFFVIVYYFAIIDNTPTNRLEYMVTYVPLIFSIFIMFCKIIFTSQGVTSSELGIYKILLSDPLIPLYLLTFVICIRSNHFMFFVLSSAWFISICTFLVVSTLDSEKVLSDKTSALYCIIATLISCILGISVYIYSKIHKRNPGQHHRIASTALISYSITMIIFMSLYL